MPRDIQIYKYIVHVVFFQVPGARSRKLLCQVASSWRLDQYMFVHVRDSMSIIKPPNFEHYTGSLQVGWRGGEGILKILSIKMGARGKHKTLASLVLLS